MESVTKNSLEYLKAKSSQIIVVKSTVAIHRQLILFNEAGSLHLVKVGAFRGNKISCNFLQRVSLL